MLDIEKDEKLEPVIALAEALIGRRPHPATTWRWVSKGAYGEKLQVVVLLGEFHTTRKELLRFLNARTQAKLTRNGRNKQPANEPKPNTTTKHKKLRDAGLQEK